ncbi:MAG: nickel pincer cofactor biosynthesis protein LarC [Lachnospiraceae bacterium]|nr:nickel pincer cofactor biosynthesis protein LarC [Lachnospiraceae bacterium]
MRVLYFDCGMGAAGDMMTAALLELLPENEQEAILDELRGLGFEGVSVSRERTEKCGITGSHMVVSVHGESEISEDHHHSCDEGHHHHNHDGEGNHHHSHDDGGHHAHHHSHDDGGHYAHHHSHPHMHMEDIENIIDGLRISDKVKEDVKSVYKLIAEAESHAHGKEVSEIHFHEVGMKDAIMDITAVCLLMDRIAPDKVISSAVHTGSGQVRCAHGIVPVPAPATAYILRGIPIYSTDIKGELCTPTGAALIKYYTDEFGALPVTVVEKTGYGMGTKDFPVANCLRAMIGNTISENGGNRDVVEGLACNIDDMTGEEIGFAMERLYELGAKEVYTIPVGMKKSRPGIVLEVLCRPEDREKMVDALFRYTTTLGVRQTSYTRYILKRDLVTDGTPFGEIRRKHSEGYGVERDKYEYEDLAAAAVREGCTVREVREKIKKSSDA